MSTVRSVLFLMKFLRLFPPCSCSLPPCPCPSPLPPPPHHHVCLQDVWERWPTWWHQEPPPLLSLNNTGSPPCPCHLTCHPSSSNLTGRVKVDYIGQSTSGMKMTCQPLNKSSFPRLRLCPTTLTLQYCCGCGPGKSSHTRPLTSVCKHSTCSPVVSALSVVCWVLLHHKKTLKNHDK